MRRSKLSWSQPFERLAVAIVLGAACLSASLSPAAAAAAEPEPARLVSLGKCLSTNDAGIDGAPAVLSTCTGSRGQQWKLPQRGFSGPITGAGGKCLDVTGNNPADRTPIIVFSCHGLPNQSWRHEPDGRIVGLGSKCLDVLASNTADGTPLILFPCNTPTDNQLWRAEQPSYFHSEPLLSGANIVDLAFSPARPRHVFAAALGHGILRSENDGRDFTIVHRGVPAGGGATAVAVDAVEPDIVLAVQNGQLLRSANGGSHFSVVAGAPAGLVSIATDPFTALRVVATDGTWVYESFDGGLSFQPHQFPAQQQTGTLRQLVFDPLVEGRLWLAAAAQCAFCTGADQGVYRSDDDSFLWTKMLGDPTERVVADPGAAGHLYAIQDRKLFRTANAGQSWQLVETFDSALTDVWVDSHFPGRITAAHRSGMSRSADGGATFAPVAFGIRQAVTGGAAEHVSRLLWTGDLLLAAMTAADHHLGRGLWVSFSLGSTFSLWNDTFAAEHIADLDGFAGGQQIWAAGRDGIYYSGDGGVRYERSWELTKLEAPEAVMVDPYDPTGRTVYAAASRRAGPSDGFLWKTTDGGGHWQEVAGTTGGSPIEVGGLIATSHGGKKIYLTTIDGTLGGTQYRGVLSSENGGVPWKPLDLGVHVELLAKRPDDPALYAAGDALLRSTDGGETWHQRQQVPATAMTTFGDELFLAGPGLFHSSGDQGATLESHDLPQAIAEPAALLATADRIYLGDRAGGLFASVDRGRSWTALDLGLPAAPVTSLLAAQGRLYAGTAGAGLFQAAALPAKAPLFFGGGRFTASIVWKDFLGQTGSGQAAVWTDDSGFFWFFDPNNVEVMVKLLDARSYNGHYWVFVGSLSNVEFTLTVRDEYNGAVRTYHNPLGSFASFGDLGAFVGESHISLAEGPASAPIETKAAPAAAASTPVVTVGERFEISVAWEDGFGQFGQGLGRRVTGDTAAFTFFSPTNTELVIKVLDGRTINGHFWVFYGALTNVGYVITIKDLETGEQVLYHNPVGQFGSFGDITAF
jgi:hypothetical protein